jgi:hypothetical protein
MEDTMMLAWSAWYFPNTFFAVAARDPETARPLLVIFLTRRFIEASSKRMMGNG